VKHKKSKHLRGKGKPEPEAETTDIVTDIVSNADPGTDAGPDPQSIETTADQEANAPSGAAHLEPASEVDTAAAEPPQQEFLPLVSIRAVLEALLLVSPEPIDPASLAKTFPEFQKADIENAIQALTEEYGRDDRGIRIKNIAEGYRLETRPEFDPWLERFFEVESEAKLSLAALETLAIVAYRQPITVPEVNEVRGVNSAGVIRTLLERKLIRIHGRKPVVGSPFMYRTTKQFLEHFGLATLAELPKPEEMEQLLGEGVKLPGELAQMSMPLDELDFVDEKEAPPPVATSSGESEASASPLIVDPEAEGDGEPDGHVEEAVEENDADDEDDEDEEDDDDDDDDEE